MSKTNERITLPVFGGIIIDLVHDASNPDDIRTGGYIIAQELEEQGDDSPEAMGAIHGLTSMILACACAGVDVKSPAFLEAIKTTSETIANRF